MSVILEIDTTDFDRHNKERERRYPLALSMVSPRFRAYMVAQTDSMFLRLKHGGSRRGVTWAKFKSPRVPRGGTRFKRRKDGTRVRVRKYVPAEVASLMQDSMNLRRNAANAVFAESNTEIAFGSRVAYAARQQALRPFLFFEHPKDTEQLSRAMLTEMMKGQGQKK